MVTLSELRELSEGRDGPESGPQPVEGHNPALMPQQEEFARLCERIAGEVRSAAERHQLPEVRDMYRPSKVMADAIRRIEDNWRSTERIIAPVRRIYDQLRDADHLAQSIRAMQVRTEPIHGFAQDAIDRISVADRAMRTIESAALHPGFRYQLAQPAVMGPIGFRSPIVDGVARIEAPLRDAAAGVEKLRDVTLDVARRADESAEAHARRFEEQVERLQLELRRQGAEARRHKVESRREARRQQRRERSERWVELLVSAVLGGVVAAVVAWYFG